MDYDAVVVGAGVIGCAAAMELTKYRLRICVLEKTEDVCTGTSKANSSIIHAGFDAPPGSRKARFNVQGSRLMPALCQRLDIPFRRNGALVLCFSPEERPALEALLRRGEANGVEGLRLVESAELRTLERSVSETAIAALYAPTSGIVCPFELTAAMAENAVRNGCDFRFGRAVLALRREADGWRLETDGGPVTARYVINAAGLYADELHNQVSEEKVEIRPRRGEYCLLDKKAGGLVEHTVFQLPTAMGKGTLVTPTVHGNILVGPTAEDLSDKTDTGTTSTGLAKVMANASRSIPYLPWNRTITSFAGLRAHLVRGGDDFLVGGVPGVPGYAEAAGIESPGLSSAPAIGAYLAGLCAEALDARENAAYDPGRDRVVRPEEMSFAERQALIRVNPAYDRIVCRCERVSEGEVVDAIRRRPGARSLDGVKRRTRAGMGRCQGGFCAPRVMEILSRELGVPQTELTKGGGESLLLAGLLRKEDEA